jgi:hypothetical protein
LAAFSITGKSDVLPIIILTKGFIIYFNLKFNSSGIRYPVSGIRYPASGIQLIPIRSPFHLIHNHLEGLHIINGRLTVLKIQIRIVAHDHIQSFDLFIMIIDEDHLAISQHTAVAHTPAAGNLFVDPAQLMVCTERDANTVVIPEDIDLLSRPGGMKVYGPVSVTKIEGQDIGLIPGINHADVTYIAFLNDPVQLFL